MFGLDGTLTVVEPSDEPGRLCGDGTRQRAFSVTITELFEPMRLMAATLLPLPDGSLICKSVGPRFLTADLVIGPLKNVVILSNASVKRIFCSQK